MLTTCSRCRRRDYCENCTKQEDCYWLKAIPPEGGVVIKPYCPVKVGDMVYTIRDNAAIGYRVTEKSEGNGWMVISARRNDGRLSFGLLDIGKTVFLTREEAEKALEAEQDS